MIVVLKKGSTEDDITNVVNKIGSLGRKAHISKGDEITLIGAIGENRDFDPKQLLAFDCVATVTPILKPYKLVSREYKKENTIIELDGVTIGGNEVPIIAGPCSVESEEQVLETARAIKASGAKLLRGGAFKPRTSPYSFQGMGEEGLKILQKAKEETGLLIVTELMDAKHLPLLEKYADIIQIGTRNMQNFDLLKAVGKINKPVMLKRGMSATLKEFLMSAEYIMSEGNKQVILCERGIRTFCTHSRNTLDLNIVPVLKEETHLPVIVDPSHGTGKLSLIEPMSKASIACGADALAIEVHPNPQVAYSDGDQSLTPSQFDDLMKNIIPVAEAVGRKI